MKTKTMKNIFIVEVTLSFIIFLMGKSFVPIATYVLALAILTKLFIIDKERKE
ncbi:hypothetical protein ACRPK2_10450 [Lactococcus garvieae]|uniref:hypothetical protein n=1 Tax=Lactococcus garvieae TaxID=1363 RepID=UPI003D774BD3